MKIGLGFGVKGSFRIELVEKSTGCVVKQQSVGNMLLTGYLDGIFGEGGALLSPTDRNMAHVEIDRVDAAYNGYCLASDNDEANNVDMDASVFTDHGYIEGGCDAGSKDNMSGATTGGLVWNQRYFAFPDDSDITVNSVGIVSFAGDVPLLVARQVLDEPVVVAPGYELRVIWRVTVDLNNHDLDPPEPRWETTIVAGQSDGETDIGCRLTINRQQLRAFCSARSHDHAAGWLPMTCRLGASNRPSNLVTDFHINLREPLTDSEPESVAHSTYTAGDHGRDVTFTWAHDAPHDVEIGEALLVGIDDNDAEFGIARVEFSPKLKKTERMQMALTFNFAVESP